MHTHISHRRVDFRPRLGWTKSRARSTHLTPRAHRSPAPTRSLELRDPRLDRLAPVAAVAPERDRRDAAPAGLLVDPRPRDAEQLRHVAGRKKRSSHLNPLTTKSPWGCPSAMRCAIALMGRTVRQWPLPAAARCGGTRRDRRVETPLQRTPGRATHLEAKLGLASRPSEPNRTLPSRESEEPAATIAHPRSIVTRAAPAGASASPAVPPLRQPATARLRHQTPRLTTHEIQDPALPIQGLVIPARHPLPLPRPSTTTSSRLGSRLTASPVRSRKGVPAALCRDPLPRSPGGMRRSTPDGGAAAC